MKVNCLFTICICSLFLITNPTYPKGIDCRKAENIVEISICENSDLLNFDGQISDLYGTILKSIEDEQLLKIFKTQHYYWLRERNNCQNQDTMKGDYKILVYKALYKTMSERVVSMTEISKNTSLIDEYASSFSFIDPWYFLLYKKEYIRKKVHIFGQLVIPDDNQPTKGVIIGKDRSQVNVIFKRMPENQFFFLKENNPISHHEGIVVEKNGEIFLYMTNILGTEL